MSWRQSTSAIRDEVPMSRALNIAADANEVRAICAKHQLSISALETLLSGGTRVVLQNGDDAARLRTTMKAKLITGSVKRDTWAGQRGGI